MKIIHVSRITPFLNVLSIAIIANFAYVGSALSQNEPDKVQRRFEPRVAIPSQPSIPVAPQVETKKSHSYKQAFTLKGINFQGVTVYSDSELQVMASKLIGQQVTLNDVDAIADEILARYRADSYILVVGRVKDTKPSNGVVTIQFVEGYIGNVIIDGRVKANSRGQALLTEIGQKISQDRPLKASTLERYLLLIDDLPGVTAKGVVRRGSGAAAELVVVMDHKDYDGSLEVNNRGTRFIGRGQMQATLAANSLFGIYDRTIIRGVTATPVKELKFFDIQHEEQLTAEGTKVKLIAGHSEVEPGDTLKTARIRGESTNYEIVFESPIVRSRKENFTPRATLSYLDSEVKTLGVVTSKDKVRAARIGANYDIQDNWNGVNVVDAEISQGLDVFGATDKGAGRSRIDGENDFTKMTLDLIRLQPLPNNFSILASATGQYSLDPLLSSEEFAIGGSAFGGAYDPAELTGDHGAAAKVELRWANDLGYQWLQNYQIYSYYDIGSIWQKNAPVGVIKHQSLASVGVGVRTNFNQHFSGLVEIAKPLTRKVAAEGNDDTRIFFDLIGRF